VIARHYPDCAGAAPYACLLEAVISAQATLVAHWMSIGFIHGVMNTDNMSVTGETIDYGPCAFLDVYHPATVFSSIDEQGRYAFGNQPLIARWNLTRFAETLLPLLAEDADQAVAIAQEALDRFDAIFQDALLDRFRGKLGLMTQQPDDADLIRSLLEEMQRGEIDFTLLFRYLSEDIAGPLRGDGANREPDQFGRSRALFAEPAPFDAWLARWRQRLSREPASATARGAAMLHTNPLFIPRNHRIEAAIVSAVERDDFGPFETLVDLLASPFDDQPGREAYALGPAPAERVTATFCGT